MEKALNVNSIFEKFVLFLYPLACTEVTTEPTKVIYIQWIKI